MENGWRFLGPGENANRADRSSADKRHPGGGGSWRPAERRAKREDGKRATTTSTHTAEHRYVNGGDGTGGREADVNGAPQVCRHGAGVVASTRPEKRFLQAGDNNNQRRKLILHFDVRNTVLVADSVWSVNVEQALNNYLSGVTWGRETSDGGWEWVSVEPSQKPPGPGLMTFYKHLERQTRSTASDRAALRRLTGDFTQEAAGRRFLPYFRRLLKLLEWPHGEPNELLTMEGRDGRLYHYLIPAFLHLLKVLSERDRDFGIVFRTYGMDAPQVLLAVEQTVWGRHPSFPNPIRLSVHTQPGRVVRGADDRVQFECTTRALGKTPRTEVVGTDGAIYRLLSASEGVTGYVDHFQHWADHDFRHDAAKPFWIDESDPEVQHIFFDDNIRSEDADSIVDVRTFTDATRSKARSLRMDEWPRYEGACLVQADLLQSIGNRNYFVEQIEQCERSYDALLEKANARRASKGSST